MIYTSRYVAGTPLMTPESTKDGIGYYTQKLAFQKVLNKFPQAF